MYNPHMVGCISTFISIKLIRSRFGLRNREQNKKYIESHTYYFVPIKLRAIIDITFQLIRYMKTMHAWEQG